MNPSIPSHLESAYGKCQKLAFAHYENFPVASLLLPKESRPHVAALYAFARTADDFADEPQPPSLTEKKGAISPDLSGVALAKPEAEKTAKGGGDSVKKRRFSLLNQWDKQFQKTL